MPRAASEGQVAIARAALGKPAQQRRRLRLVQTRLKRAPVGDIGMKITILGSGGWVSSDERETACALVEDERGLLLLDAGSGARRLLTDSFVTKYAHLEVLLTHFHLDHIVGLGRLAAVASEVIVWAPGDWLYGTRSAAILQPLLAPPLVADDLRGRYTFHELRAGPQYVGRFPVVAAAQPNHWSPSVGLRIGDDVALVTDTPYERSSATLARGVRRLLHEAWSTSAAPLYPERDATAADAARVAVEADVDHLTLIHLDPRLRDVDGLLDDARSKFASTDIGIDLMVLDT